MPERLGVPVVDAHTHAFPPEWVADRVNHCQRDRWFGSLYEAPSAKMIDAVELMSAMDSAGVALARMTGIRSNRARMTATSRAL